MTLAFFLAITAFSIVKHQNLWSDMYDFGQELQVHWNTANGRWFQSSVEVPNNLGDHTTYLTLVTAAVYRLLPFDETLLVWQSLIYCLGVIPAWRIARRYLHREDLAFFVGAAYLLQPAAGLALAYEYHVLAFAPPLALWAFDALSAGRVRGAWLPLILLLLVREDCGLTAAAVGLLAYTGTPHRRTALAMTLAGLLAFAVNTFVMLPLFRGAPSDTLARYGHLGDSAGSILLNLLTRPGLWAELVREDARRLLFPVLLMLPWLFTPARVGMFWPALGLTILPGVLSNNPCQYTLGWHYPLIALPVLTIGSVLGMQRLALRPRPLRGVWACVLVLLCTQSVFVTQRWFLLPNPTRHDFERLAAQIPPDAPLSATGKLGAALADRRQIAIYPITSWSPRAFPRLPEREADYVFIDEAYPLLRAEDRVPDPSRYTLSAQSGTLRLYVRTPALPPAQASRR